MTRNFLYEDRDHAGSKLAKIILSRRFENPIILGLPRGGVVLAKKVARLLETHFDVVISRKIGAPGHLELGIGAISEDEEPYFSPEYASLFDRHSPEVSSLVNQETDELRRRIELYRNGTALPMMNKHTVIVVDDGLATGVTAIAAGKFLRSLSPLKLILAVPLGPDDYSRELHKYYDEIICPFFIPNMLSIGMWYRDFPQLDDQEVLWSLNRQIPGGSHDNLSIHTGSD